MYMIMLPWEWGIWLNLSSGKIFHEFCFFNFRFFTFYNFRTKDFADLTDKQIDDSFNKFLLENHIRIDKRETELALSGQDVVDNGMNKAVAAQVR